MLSEVTQVSTIVDDCDDDEVEDVLTDSSALVQQWGVVWSGVEVRLRLHRSC